MKALKTSPKRLAANRANAAKSTGPRTPEGKATSARNAVRHGFAGSTYAVVRMEEVHEVDRLKADLVDTYKPINSQEIFALERVALAQLQLLRAARLEAGYFTTCLDLALDKNDSPILFMENELVADVEVTRAQNRNFLLAEGFRRQTAATLNPFALVLRYQTLAERQYRRAIEEFERLVTLRARLQEDPPNEPITVPEPPEPQAVKPSDHTREQAHAEALERLKTRRPGVLPIDAPPAPRPQPVEAPQESVRPPAASID